jgi:phosphomannomutase
LALDGDADRLVVIDEKVWVMELGDLVMVKFSNKIKKGKIWVLN